MMILITFGLGVFCGMVIVSKPLQAKLCRIGNEISQMVQKK